MKLECQRPLDNLIAATLAAEGEQDREKKDELLKLFENALSAFNASQLKCTEMKQDFDTSMARYHHDMELSRGELEAVKRYEYSLHHHGEK